MQFGFNDGRTFHQITIDDGLLNTPVALTRLRLGSGERAEILVDFSGQNGNTYYINQFGNELPAGFPVGPSTMGSLIGPYDNITFNFLQINVVAPTASPITTIPTTLTTNTPWSSIGSTSMNFLIQGSPMMSMTNFTINGVQYDEMVINFTKQQNDVMVWNITNQSMMAHPFHIHGNHFFITSINGATPPLNMQGRKDVVLVSPQGGTATLSTKYEDFNDPMMPYMYHCHILSHEDNGMMGQFIINPSSAGIDDINSGSDCSIFSSIMNGSLEILIQSTKELKGDILLVNALGQQIEKIPVEINVGENNYSLPYQTSYGMYFLILSSSDGRVYQSKIITTK